MMAFNLRGKGAIKVLCKLRRRKMAAMKLDVTAI
jgi:hypothetical protein